MKLEEEWRKMKEGVKSDNNIVHLFFLLTGLA